MSEKVNTSFMECVDVAAFFLGTVFYKIEEYIFIWFYRSVGLERKIRFASAMECVDVAAFTFSSIEDGGTRTPTPWGAYFTPGIAQRSSPGTTDEDCQRPGRKPHHHLPH